MQLQSQVVLNDKQNEFVALLNGDAKFILARGASRASKTFAILYAILQRALIAPKSRHGIFRKTVKDVKRKLFDLSMKDVMNKAYPTLWERCKINISDMTIELPNGSIILFDGLDDRERLESILGDEFNTVFINEISQFPTYEPIEMLMTRLSLNTVKTNGKILKNLFLMDCNPPDERHWSYSVFKLGVHPETKKPHHNPASFAEIKMLAEDNRAVLNADYFDTMANVGGRKRKRFVEGEWGRANEHAIFKAEWIEDARHEARDHREEQSDLIRIGVAIDPAVSNHAGSDETGIIVVGMDADRHCFVLEDRSGKYTPNEWAKTALDAYDRWQCDFIIAEKNQGGDMVSNTIKMARANAPVKLVHASRGKLTRAEPVAYEYEQGRVHHCGDFEALEGQLENFTIDLDRRRNGSPDRLDALVWGISELAITDPVKRGAKVHSIANFWG